MSAGAQVDYRRLAEQFGGKPAQGVSVDYTALAAQFGGKPTEDDPQKAIKEKHGIPLDLDLSKGYFHPWNIGPIGVYEKAKKPVSPEAFSAAAREFEELSKSPPNTGVLAGVGRRAGQVAGSLVAPGTAMPGGIEPVVEYAAGVAESPVNIIPGAQTVRQRAEQFKTDPGGAIGETAVDAVLLAAGVKGTKAALTGEVPKMPRPSNLLELGRRPQVAHSVVKEAMSLPPKAVSGVEDIFRAAAPTGTKVGFRQNMYAAAGDLAEIAETLDLKKARGGIRNPDFRPRETVNALNAHLAKMDATERLPQIQRNAQVPVATKVSGDAAEGLRFIERSAGQEADRLLAAKMAQSETMPLAELDRLARVVNKELLDFERLTPDQRLAAKVTNRRIGSLKELDKALSKALNDALEQRGEVGLRQYERRFAALSAVRDQLQMRLNAIELQRSTLPGRLARSAMGGKAGIASASQAAVADVNIGRLLESGFSQLRETKLKANRGIAPTPRRVRGLLPETTPPIVTPEGVNQPIPAAGARRYNY